MAKKDGLEIFELFRSGSSKSEAPDATPPPAPARERSTARESRPTPAPSPSAPASMTNPGETRISLRLNTALFGLMVGTACLFGTFALGVQYERRHRAAAAPAAEEAKVASTEDAQPQPLPSIIRETRRENPPTVAQPASGETRVPPPAAEPRKGWTLQLMCYTPEQESTAQFLLKKVRDAGGADAGLVRDKSNNFVVVAGFVEKQSGAEAEAVLNKYRNLAGRLNKSFNLDWIGATR